MATENKNLSQYDKKIIPNAESLRFGIITSQWNEQITYGMRNGAIETLKDCGAIDTLILCVKELHKVLLSSMRNKVKCLLSSAFSLIIPSSSRLTAVVVSSVIKAWRRLLQQ